MATKNEKGQEKPRAAAARAFAEFPAIVEIFYGDLDPSPASHRVLRERLLPLPPIGDQGAVRTLILGNSGVGKTTLLRRVIGCNSERDRFPATSANRTTTCEIEVIAGQKDYSAAVLFLTRHQAQQEIIESLSDAVLKAIEQATDDVVMTELLEQSDQRFRLKYVLGGWQTTKSKQGGSSVFGAPAFRGRRRAWSLNTSAMSGISFVIDERGEKDRRSDRPSAARQVVGKIFPTSC